MKKLTIEGLINEVELLEVGETLVVTDGQDVALTTAISKVEFLESDMILVGGYGSPISSYQIFDNLSDVTQEAIDECVQNVFNFFKEDVEDLQEVVLVRRGSNSLDFTV